jgi:hypothetical protein
MVVILYIGKSLLDKMRTALIEYSIQRRLFEDNEKGWREDGKEIETWKDEVLRWERMPKKWLAGESNPYHPRVKSTQQFVEPVESMTHRSRSYNG